MKRNNLASLLLVAMAMAGCGGGGSDGSGASTTQPAPVAVPSPVPTPVPTPVPAPVPEPIPVPVPVATMTVQSGAIARVIAKDTGIQIDVTAQAANFTPAGTLFASASDSAGLVQPAVTVTANGAGSYTFTLTTLASQPASRYTGNVTIKLCSDAPCTVAQAVPSITVPYDVTVQSNLSAWPGDKLTALSALSGVADWATFQGNNAHTGYVPIDVNADKMVLRWKRGAVNNSGSNFSATISPLVTSNGRFFASGDKKLTAYQESDGAPLWSYDTTGLTYASVNPPAVDGGVVYMAAGQQQSTYMLAFDAADGSLRMKSAMTSQWDNYLSPIVQNGAVYTNGGSYGGIYGFATTGEQLFFSSLSQTSGWSPAGDARAIYAYTGDALTLFEPKTGTVLSSIKDTGFSNYVYQVGGSAVIGANGGVYAAAYANGYLNGGNIGNALTRFDTLKGFVDWRVPGVYRVTPAYADGVLYAPNANPYRIEARAEATGALLWSWIPPLSGETSFFASPVVTKNLLITSTNLNTYAIDLKSHKVVWSYPAPGYLAISQNGILYIQSTDGLVAVNLK
jgi:outer membrane protein assembly factor BamB